MAEHPVTAMRSALDELYSRTVTFIRDCPPGPVSGSIAESEIVKIGDSVMSAATNASMIIEDAGDHITGLVKLSSEPLSLTACFTCIRSMLEGCSIGAWLVDPLIDAKHRRARLYAYQLEGLAQKRNFVNSLGDVAESNATDAKIATLKSKAQSFNYSLSKGPDDQTIGIRMPKATQMIDQVLGSASFYKFLSGFAHSHHFARQIIYKPTGKATVAGASGTQLVKHLNIEAFAMLAHGGLKAFAKVLINKTLYMGYDKLVIEEILEDASDKLQVDIAKRFWRS